MTLRRAREESGLSAAACALQVLEALQRGAAHESLVCCAAYLLGEYGRQVQQVPLRDQFALLQERFVTVSSEAKVILSAQLSSHAVLAIHSTCTIMSGHSLNLYHHVCKHSAALA